MPNPGLAYKMAELVATSAISSFPTAAAPANNAAFAAVMRDIWDSLRNGTGGAEPATNRSLADYLGVSPTFYDPVLGYCVTKTSSLADGSGTDDLFTVTGSNMLTLLIGEVTTIVATTTTMKLRDTTNSIDLCAATTITTDAVGTMYALTNIAGSILNGTGMTPVVGSVPNLTGSTNFMVRVIGGATPLTISHVLDGAGTGAVKWTAFYKPLSATSSIVAAA